MGMKATNTHRIPNKNIVRIAVGAALVLLIPLVAMQFSEEVDWDLADFIIIGILLFGTGLAYELIASRLRNKNHRIVAGVVLLVLLLYVWAELAVGIFTNLGS